MIGSKKTSGLSQTLGTPMLSFYGIGMILGAGIYSIIGKAAAQAGASLWISFLLASIVAFLTALSYAELSTMFPKAGAEYIYLKNAFPKWQWLGAVIGFAMAFSGAATATTVAVAFHGYLNHFWQAPQFIIAFTLLLIFTGVAIWGVRESGWANIIFTLIEVSGLLLIIYLGFQSPKMGEALTAMPSMETLSGAALVVFAFFGFESIVTMAEEAKDPVKSLPKAIFLSLTIATTLYFLVSLSALALSSPKELAQSDAALLTVTSTSSPAMGEILGIIALFSTANTALISMVGASRLIFGMSQEKSLPSLFSKILPKRKTPWIANLLVLIFAVALLPLGNIATLASISSLCTMLTFLMINLSLIALRIHSPEKKRNFRIALNFKNVPISAILGAILCLIFLFQFENQVYTIGGLFLIACLIGFILFKKMTADPSAS